MSYDVPWGACVCDNTVHSIRANLDTRNRLRARSRRVSFTYGSRVSAVGSGRVPRRTGTGYGTKVEARRTAHRRQGEEMMKARPDRLPLHGTSHLPGPRHANGHSELNRVPRDFRERDWERDANGKHHLTRAEFFSSWFQLTDANTIGVQAGEYAAFILRMTDRIARVRTVDGRLVGGYEWRDDRAIWAESNVDRVLTRHAQKKAATALRAQTVVARVGRKRPTQDQNVNLYIRPILVSAVTYKVVYYKVKFAGSTSEANYSTTCECALHPSFFSLSSVPAPCTLDQTNGRYHVGGCVLLL